MPAIDPDALESQVAQRLDPHGSDGVQSALSGVVDLEALEERRYGEVLGAIDQRLTQSRYSLLSMVVAGIYFGLLVGLWLVDGSTWSRIALWLAPTLLVAVYGLYATHQTVRQIRHLSETRALLQILMNGPSAGG
ncbi:hypothetical protein GGP72_000482 [Salinibacter ruber]|uniref:Uncharacterized protein n=1 Tax=Salinibacter ruber TaxID=146919 RepID=A0A9X2Q1A1_9BACT|nr:hypothetical protein [Salinibacter ruber]MCS3676585.1 hypothetical protein [Salinibacter ruber]MCS3679873.1 hypothetical protein [Salinibacter ruber]